MTRVWRITTRRFAATAFDGEGARFYGGRWNSPGESVVYCAATASLAVLEMLVQDSPLRARYALISANLPNRLRIKKLTLRQMPAQWRDPRGNDALRVLGDQWLRSGSSAVLMVPSAVIPDESNYLLNPAHADFGHIKIGQSADLNTDARLIARFRTAPG